MKRLLNLLSFPVTFTAHVLHNRRIVPSKDAAHIICGIVFMFVGSNLAELSHHIECRYLSNLGDTFGFWLHALGGAPLIKHVAERFGVRV